MQGHQKGCACSACGCTFANVLPCKQPAILGGLLFPADCAACREPGLKGAGRSCASSSRVGYQPLEGAHSSFFLPGIISAPETLCLAWCPENSSGSGSILLLASLLTPGGAGSFPGPREIFHRQVCMSIPCYLRVHSAYRW